MGGRSLAGEKHGIMQPACRVVVVEVSPLVFCCYARSVNAHHRHRGVTVESQRRRDNSRHNESATEMASAHTARLQVVALQVHDRARELHGSIHNPCERRSHVL